MFRSVLVNLATSGGKTVIAGSIIDAVRSRGRCLFLADTDELCDQPSKKFWRLFRMATALEKAGDRASKMADVVIGSAQTLIRPERLQRFAPDHFHYIFVDEAHRGSDRNKVITDYFAGAKIAGQTATAFRKKLADLSDYYESVAYEMGMFDLVDEGYIVPYKVLTLPVEVDIRGVKQTMSVDGMDYDKKQLDSKIIPYYEAICKLVVKHASDRHIITYLPLIKSSQEFVEIAKGHGIYAKHIDGKSPDRESLIRQFDHGDIQLLSNSNLLTTGWDSPRCDCLLNLSPTRSPGLYRQKAGRIGRLMCPVEHLKNKEDRKAEIAASAKPDGLILDLLWQTEKFGLVGPADLVAANQDERLAIQMSIARLTSAQDLQAISAAVQEEREEALKKALEEAKKRRAGATDAINLIAAKLHGRKVINYEPVMKWESKVVSDKQKEWLVKQGIDPDSAKDRGHVSALMSLMWQRKRLGLASWRVVEALEKKNVKGAIHFRDEAAYKILQGDYPFPFGKYARRKATLSKIPLDMLAWCADPKQSWIRREYPAVWDWVKRRIDVRDQEDRADDAPICTCIGDYVPPNCPVHPRAEKEKPATAEMFFDCLD